MLILPKKIPVEKGSWWLSGLKLKNKNQNQSLAAIAEQGFSLKLCLGRNLHWTAYFHTEPPPCCLSQPMYRSSWNRISANRAETLPVQSELHSYILIGILNDQSEQLHFDQSGQCILYKWNWGFGVLICMRTSQSGTRDRDFFFQKIFMDWF